MERTPNLGGRPSRPMPADFAEVAWLSQSYLCPRYKTGSETIARWRRELGGEDPRKAMLQPPADFVEQAGHRNLTQLCAHYHVGERRVKSWAKRAGVQIKLYLSLARRGVPDDFAECAAMMSRRALCRYYRAEIETVKRWLSETGINAMVYVPPQPTPRNPRPFVFGGHARTRQTSDMRQTSMFDEAADTLRRHFVVFRCDDRGRADQKGEFWRLGNTLLTPDELLQRAEKYRRKVA